MSLIELGGSSFRHTFGFFKYGLCQLFLFELGLLLIPYLGSEAVPHHAVIFPIHRPCAFESTMLEVRASIPSMKRPPLVIVQ